MEQIQNDIAVMKTYIRNKPEGFVAHCPRCQWNSSAKESADSARRSFHMHQQSAHTKSFRKKRIAGFRRALAAIQTPVESNGHTDAPTKRRYTRRQRPHQEPDQSALLAVLDRHPFCSGCGNNIREQLLATAARLGVPVA